MRRMILTTLVLLPVLAHAQASTSAEPQPSPSSANLHAELTQPAGAANFAMAEVNSAAKTPATSILSMNAVNHPAFRELVQFRMTDDFTDAALRRAGTFEYVMYGGDAAAETTTPSLTRAVEINLTQDELAAQPTVTNVVLHATVDAYGFPRGLTVAQSAGTSLDKKALTAVSQYRFKPATQDNRPVDAAVLITIKIQKP